MTDSPSQTDHNDTTPPRGPVHPQSAPPMFNLHGSIVALSLLCIAVHVVRTQFLSEQADLALLIQAAFFPVRYSPTYFHLDLATLISPVTYAFLHGSWIHLGINMVWLAIFGSPLAYRLGWGRSILFWLVTAAAAAATHLVVYFGDSVPVIGASGAVSGFMGAAARFGLRANRRMPRRGFDGRLYSIGEALRMPGVVPFLAVWIVVNIVVGIDPFGAQQGGGIAWEAHIGGLVAGFFLIPLFDRRT